MNERPIPYNEDADPDIFWQPDPFDKFLPEQGFITDFVYSLRGTEVPTAFAVWSALYLLSTVLKRESYIKWFDDKLYTNYYTILVGTAGLVKKGTVLSRVDKILRKFPYFIDDVNVRYIKTPKLLKNKATPEAMIEAMTVDKKGGVVYNWLDDKGKLLLVDGKPVTYKKTSELGLLLPELAVFASKQKYNTGTIETLLDLYDCHEEWETRTIARGLQKLRYLHTTMLAAATEPSFQESIPRVAVGDGFLSRTVVVLQRSTNRRFSMPRIVENAPDIDELSRRVAWIAETYWGPFEMSEKAWRYYDSWYMAFMDHLEKEPNPGIHSRLYTTVLKVSMLLAVQRYAEEFIIDLPDMKSAIKLVEATAAMTPALLEEIDGDDAFKKLKRVLQYVKARGSVTRRTLMKNLHLSAEGLRAIIQQLYLEGAVTILANGKPQSRTSANLDETYRYNKSYEDVEENNYEAEV